MTIITADRTLFTFLIGLLFLFTSCSTDGNRILNEEAEIELNYWICPCISMRERKECHCKLFVQPTESYASKSQKIDLDTIYNNL